MYVGLFNDYQLFDDGDSMIIELFNDFRCAQYKQFGHFSYWFQQLCLQKFSPHCRKRFVAALQYVTFGISKKTESFTITIAAKLSVEW